MKDLMKNVMYETMHAGTHQSLGLTSSERVLGRAVASAAKMASCLKRYY